MRHFQDPTAEELAAAAQILETLSAPPSNDRYAILYHPSTSTHLFEIAIRPQLVLPDDQVEFVSIVEGALAWMRGQGYEPCLPPLIKVLFISNPPPFDGPPPAGYQPYEPCREPTEYQATLVEQIYESLPRPLPATGGWEVRWTGDPGIGLFQVWAIDRQTNAEFEAAMVAAQDWFRAHGHEPCRYPLAGLIGYTSDGGYPPEPTGVPWEPCKE